MRTCTMVPASQVAGRTLSRGTEIACAQGGGWGTARQPRMPQRCPTVGQAWDTERRLAVGLIVLEKEARPGQALWIEICSAFQDPRSGL